MKIRIILLALATLALAGCGPDNPRITATENLTLPDGRRVIRYRVHNDVNRDHFIYVVEQTGEATTNRVEGGKYKHLEADATLSQK